MAGEWEKCGGKIMIGGKQKTTARTNRRRGGATNRLVLRPERFRELSARVVGGPGDGGALVVVGRSRACARFTENQ